MLTLLALTLMAPQITDPYEDPAKAEQKIVDDGLKEVVSIDRELGEIKENADELSRSKALLDDEVASLKVRYPGIVIPVRATTAQVYRALQNYREVRASLVRPIPERRVVESRKKVCAAANSVRNLQKDLEETDEYKRATLSERMEIRRSFDTFKRLPDGSVCPQ